VDVPPTIPLTFQATSWLVVPVTEAVNWRLAPVEMVRVVGLIVTVVPVGGGVVPPPLPDPPQEAMRDIRRRPDSTNQTLCRSDLVESERFFVRDPGETIRRRLLFPCSPSYSAAAKNKNAPSVRSV
jgi:hypothetical protein